MLNIIKKFLVISVCIIAFPIILFVISKAVYSFFEFRAYAKASNFCGAIPVGTKIQEVIDRANTEEVLYYGPDERLVFQFNILLASTFDCIVQTEGGAVKELTIYKDTW
jgi:hypothetical protein